MLYCLYNTVLYVPYNSNDVKVYPADVKVYFSDVKVYFSDVKVYLDFLKRNTGAGCGARFQPKTY